MNATNSNLDSSTTNLTDESFSFTRKNDSSNTDRNSTYSGTDPTSDMPGPLLLWLELTAFVIIDVIGLIGNFLVIAIVAWNARMRLSANLFILSLCFADLMVSLLVTPMVILSRKRRTWQMGHSLCQLQAFVNHTCLFASIFNLAAIAVNRAVATRMSHRYHVIFSIPLSVAYIGVTWFCSILYALLPIMGWGLYAFDRKRFNCIFSRQAAPSFLLFFATCCVILPLVTCAVSYTIVWNVFVKSRRNLRRFGSSAISGPAISEITLTKNLFVVWLAFFVCWLPMNVLFLVDAQGHLDDRLYTFAVWLMLCNSCVNPIIYSLRKNFRIEYLRFFRRLQCQRSGHRVHPSGTTH